MRISIEYQCPQCGAPATLEETDRLFSCQYCRVRSYLYHKDYFQYILPSKVSDTKNLFFMPYWRFKGMLFSCIEKQIGHMFVDVSLQAFESIHFPVSVGLRSQALKLRFVTPDMKGYFVKPKLTFQNVVSTLMSRFAPSPPEIIQHQTYIGESISIIYSPFYLAGHLYDAVLNKSVQTKLPDDFDVRHFPGGEPEWALDFLPTLCPACGWDLKGKRDANALICDNCISVWMPISKKLKRLNFGCLTSSIENAVYFPFWRIKADISGISLKSYADLIKIANLPKAVQKEWDKIDFHFWSPGFKVRPKTFLRLLSQTTTAQPMDELRKQLPHEKIFPVTLSAKEATETLKINLAGFIKNDTLLENLSQININPTSILLVFIPFKEDYHDFIQPKYQISINKNQLKLSRNL